MITLTQTESALSLSANIRPKGYEGAEFVPEGLTVEVVGRNNGALLQHIQGNIDGDRLSVDIDLDDVQDVDTYDLVINYRLRDARYLSGYRAVSIIETAFEARRSENTSVLGGGNTARATVIAPVESVGAGPDQSAGSTLDLANLSPEQIEALKQALGISGVASDAPQAIDLASLVGSLSDGDKNVVVDGLLSPLLARVADSVSKAVDPPARYGVSTAPDGVAHIESNDGGTQLESLLLNVIMNGYGSDEGSRLRIEQLERWVQELALRIGNN